MLNRDDILDLLARARIETLELIERDGAFIAHIVPLRVNPRTRVDKLYALLAARGATCSVVYAARPGVGVEELRLVPCDLPGEQD